MFGIGMQELMIILVVALLVLGPTKLPGVARAIGKGMREVRRASDDLRHAVMMEDEPKNRWTPPPAQQLAPPSETAAHAAEAPAIHGSLAAGSAAVAANDEGSESAGAGEPSPAATEPTTVEDRVHAELRQESEARAGGPEGTLARGADGVAANAGSGDASAPDKESVPT
jgi:TatA/E family protein of Tat protein translocase